MLKFCTKPFNSTTTKLIRFAHQNHYDVLKIKTDCSQKEIRDAFIKLSKECHPDTSKIANTQTSTQFTKIMEAYKILSKPDTRANYDYDLHLLKNHSGLGFHNYEDYTNYRSRPGDPVVRSNEYYGFKGIKKVPNVTIVLLCIVFAGIGIIIQIFAITSSMTFKREQLDLQSVEAGLQHASVRADAEKYGNEAQLRRIKARLDQ